MTIRTAAVHDVVGLSASSAALFAEDGVTRDHLRNPSWPQVHGASWCAGLIEDPNTLTLIAVDQGDIVGHLIGTLAAASAMWTAPRAEIVSTFVATPWRSQGVGSRLVNDFISWAKGSGAQRLTVSAYAANTKAVHFYERHGFIPLSYDLSLDV